MSETVALLRPRQGSSAGAMQAAPTVRSVILQVQQDLCNFTRVMDTCFVLELENLKITRLNCWRKIKTWKIMNFQVHSSSTLIGCVITHARFGNDVSRERYTGIFPRISSICSRVSSTRSSCKLPATMFSPIVAFPWVISKGESNEPVKMLESHLEWRLKAGLYSVSFAQRQILLWQGQGCQTFTAGL